MQCPLALTCTSARLKPVGCTPVVPGAGVSRKRPSRVRFMCDGRPQMSTGTVSIAEGRGTGATLVPAAAAAATVVEGGVNSRFTGNAAGSTVALAVDRAEGGIIDFGGVD